MEDEINDINIPSNSILTNENIEVITMKLEEIFRKGIEKFVPTLPQNTRPPFSNNTKLILKNIHWHRNKLTRNRKGLNCPSIGKHHRNEIHLLNNLLKNSVRFDLNNAFKNKLIDSNNSRDIFQTVKHFTGKKKKEIQPIFLNDEKTNLISEPTPIANAFAQHFVANHNLSVNLTSEMDQIAIETHNDVNSFAHFVPFSENIPAFIPNQEALNELEAQLPNEQKGLLTHLDEVHTILQQRPNKKSSGKDDMPYYIMKFFSQKILIFITILFNHSLSMGYFPSAWKHANVLPIPKPGRDPTLLKNWRPISQLSCLGKIFERIILLRIDRILTNEHPNLFETQFGFRHGISVEHYLSNLQHDIDDGLNKGMCTTIVALDAQAAFDTVWHSGLIFKLKMLNFNNFILKCIASFLFNRTFSVNIGGINSTSHPILSGTPQGSVLSPRLFNLYVSDVPI